MLQVILTDHQKKTATVEVQSGRRSLLVMTMTIEIL
jgi:hypothetical protein